MTHPNLSDIALAWCRDPGIADAAARLFETQADGAYISHGELQGGRAEAPGVWASDLLQRVRDTIRAAATTPEESDGLHLATMTRTDALVGFVLVRWVRDVPRPYGVIEDLLIAASERRSGLGARAVEWVAAECRSRGLSRMFLESGITNTRAHDFFERHGFHPVSVVMMRAL